MSERGENERGSAMILQPIDTTQKLEQIEGNLYEVAFGADMPE